MEGLTGATSDERLERKCVSACTRKQKHAQRYPGRSWLHTAEECSRGARNRDEVSRRGRAVGVRLLMDSNGFGKALENAKQNTDIFSKQYSEYCVKNRLWTENAEEKPSQ